MWAKQLDVGHHVQAASIGLIFVIIFQNFKLTTKFSKASSSSTYSEILHKLKLFFGGCEQNNSM